MNHQYTTLMSHNNCKVKQLSVTVLSLLEVCMCHGEVITACVVAIKYIIVYNIDLQFPSLTETPILV